MYHRSELKLARLVSLLAWLAWTLFWGYNLWPHSGTYLNAADHRFHIAALIVGTVVLVVRLFWLSDSVQRELHWRRQPGSKVQRKKQLRQDVKQFEQCRSSQLGISR